MNHEQGSTEWLEWRNKGIGSSDAPIVMGISPWKTPFQLWEEKTGKRDPDDLSGNPAVQMGITMEPVARDAYEDKYGHLVEPLTLISPNHDFMRCSYDGIPMDRTFAFETKYSKHSFNEAADGDVPEIYIPQLDHQLACLPTATHVDFWAFWEGKGALVRHERDEGRIEDLVEAEERFWKMVQQDVAPELTSRDYKARYDDEWRIEAELYLSLKDESDSVAERMRESKKRLEALADGQSSIGGGVRLIRSFRKGTVDYKNIPELGDINLDDYRRKGSFTTSIRRL